MSPRYSLRNIFFAIFSGNGCFCTMRWKEKMVVRISKQLKSLVVLLCAVILFAGCSTVPKNDPEAAAEFKKINDPVENVNRVIFGVNQAFDKVILKPVTFAYRSLTPDFFRKGVSNFLHNLKSPVILVNDILQGEIGRAGDTVARFVINSTVGIFGLVDVAENLGFEQHNEDFGQTLAVWGFGEGPYLMLPILGPSNPRDAIGRVVDFFVDPINWWVAPDDNRIPIIRTAVSAIDLRDRLWENLEEIDKNSIDPYASYRSMYRQRRNDEIRNGSNSQSKADLEPTKPTYELAEPSLTK